MKEQTIGNFDAVCEVLDNYNKDATKLIPILQDIQDQYGYLPEDIMTFVSTALGISSSTVYGVATFFTHFTLAPKGKHIIKVCDGTACHVRKSGVIIETLEKELGLSKDKVTTDDMLFTLETVACLGACGLAPVLVIDEKVHGAMTPESTIALLNSIKEAEKNEQN
ncbi:MAG: NADH-quinone oxidoreductase subunit NuoE [Anaerovoracaceae bacterium]|jgi:NADH-quinone oxidoreductase subunit E|nr:NADH-quinone oxidoreductase subunit NuoE [Anaerovoracaceae bacterium]